MSRRAATATTSICGSPSVAGATRPTTCAVEHRLVERHRDVVLGLEADGGRRAPPRPRSAAGAACGRRRAGWRSRAGRACESLCSDEELLQRVGERVGVGDLALAEDARRRAARSPWPATSTRAVARAPRWRRCCRPRCRGRRTALVLAWSRACAAWRVAWSALDTQSAAEREALSPGRPNAPGAHRVSRTRRRSSRYQSTISSPNEQADDAAERQERPERDRAACAPPRRGGRSARPRRARRPAKPIRSAGATARPR